MRGNESSKADEGSAADSTVEVHARPRVLASDIDGDNLKMKMASNEPPPTDLFQAYSQGPSSFLNLDMNANSNKKTKSKGDQSPRPHSFLANFRSDHSRQSSQPPREPSPVVSECPSIVETPTDEHARKLIRRSSIIMSTGPGRYTYDSETVEMPHRSIESYEKNLSRSSQSPLGSSPPPSLQLNVKRQQFARRTASQLSSTSTSDRTSLRSSDVPSDVEGQASGSGSSSPSYSGSQKRLMKRDSIVQSSRDVSRALLVNGRFQNPWDTWAPIRFTNILKFGLSKDKSNVPSKEQLDIVLPVVKPHLEGYPPSDSVRVTWLGHSTILVQMDGVSILTDPMFSERASPSQVVGPKRYREMPLAIHDLPASLDAVVISHNHYDHLDMNSVTLLNARYGSDLRWFIPLGLATWFDTAGCENVVELDWWEENCIPDKGDVSFVFTPAQHWSKRTLNDDNKSLWGSWAIIGPNHRFFFTGDTGYCSAFKEIGRIYGPFTVAAIPIGAFEPRWFMKYQHVNPEEAVQIHQDLRSQFSFAIHWGTFALANEYYLDPPVKLREALEAHSIATDSFITFKHGETRLISSAGKSVADKPSRKKNQLQRQQFEEASGADGDVT